MAISVHRFADVDPQAELDDGVVIGPFCQVGPHVRIGAGTQLESHVVITGHTQVGRNNRFFPHCTIGGEPQDYSYSGAPTRCEIGDSNIFREGVTVSRGAEKEDHITRVGHNNMFMANSHVAHNCHVFNHVILCNGVLLGGHAHIHDYAILSGNALVHHFATVGTLAFVSGGAAVRADLPPYMLSVGIDDVRVITINVVGMQRRGITPAVIEIIKRAHRLLFRERKSVRTAREIFSQEIAGPFPAELTTLLDFIEHAEQGRKGRAGEARRSLPQTPPAEETNPEATPRELRRAA